MINTVSNIFFFAGLGTLVLAIVFFEIGLSYLRKNNKDKSIESNKKGRRILISSIVFFAASILVALLR